jgi:hypothetical protein
VLRCCWTRVSLESLRPRAVFSRRLVSGGKLVFVALENIVSRSVEIPVTGSRVWQFPLGSWSRRQVLPAPRRTRNGCGDIPGTIGQTARFIRSHISRSQRGGPPWSPDPAACPWASATAYWGRYGDWRLVVPDGRGLPSGNFRQGSGKRRPANREPVVWTRLAGC